ncbi:hypothetical protein [Winogradskyella sp.]|uniref:hypothetical protein n=1 Tax=Winogradskyella sp. TaxID=1883156 RepID=UPI003AB596F6
MTKTLKTGFLFSLIFLLAFSCQKEAFDSQSQIKTVSNTEALDYFNTRAEQQRNSSEPYVMVYTDYILNQDIINSDEVITVLPAVTAKGNSYSRVLMLNISGTIEAVVYSMFSDNGFSTENFFGEVLITDLDGNFLNGYSVENGLLTVQFVENSNNSSYAARGEDCPSCPFNDCSLCDSFDEVVITSTTQIPIYNIYVYQFSNIGDGSEDYTLQVPTVGGTGGGSGSSGLNTNACANGYILNDEGNCVLPEIECVEGFVLNGYGECISEDFECAEGFRLNEDGECVENPVLGADCRSFEFAKPPGALQRGCATSDFNHTFFTWGVRSNGSQYYGEIDVNIPLIYFTMPNWMTNGQAANATAIAVTKAIKDADIYFYNNPDASAYLVSDAFKNALITNLSLFGGSYSRTFEPFPILSPTPYITSVVGLSNPIDCE